LTLVERKCTLGYRRAGVRVSNVYIGTLKRAAEILGGEQELARYLKVTPSHLALWAQGLETPPMDYFLKAVDVVTEHDVSLWKEQPAGLSLPVAKAPSGPDDP
jgi:hypothetical protein